MASVFLSYDRDDAAKARPIAGALEKAGHQVWWDLHVRGGSQFSKVIEEALKASEVVVVLWSVNSIESPWVRDEAASGRDRGRLVPVRLDTAEPPLGFRQFQTIDLSQWRGRSTSPALRTLLADVASAVPRVEPKSEAPDRPPPVSTLKQARAVPRQALLIVGAAVLLLLVAGALYRTFADSGGGQPTVAVAAADGTPLSESLAHNVMVNLGSAAGSSPKFQLMDEENEARPDLRVTVSGVQQSGGKIQATVTLTSAVQKAVLWSTQLEQTPDQRSSLEQALALAAANAVTCAAEASGKVSNQLGASNLKAYLNACASLEEASEIEPLISVFRKTTAITPKFAGAWSHLLIAESELLNDPYGGATDAVRSTVRRDIQSARKIDPAMPEASLAEVALQPPTAFANRIALIDKAAAAHPDNADILGERSAQLGAVGRMDEALDDSGRAADLRPYSSGLRAYYIVMLASNGGIDKAWAELAEAKRLWPNSPAITQTDTYINLHYGDFEKAWRASGNPIDGGILGYFKIRRDPSNSNIDAWINLARTHKMLRPHRYFILQALGPLNRVDQLYQFLDQWPMEQDLQGSTQVLFRPWLANVRRDPRFMRLAQRLGLLDYWEKSGHWPDFCAEPDMPYDCKKEAAKLHA